MEQIWQLALDKGIFAVLFVALLWYTMKKNEKREERYIEREIKYQTLLERISNTLTKEVCDIKAMVTGLVNKEED